MRLYDKSLSESSILALISANPSPVHTINATAGGGGTISPIGAIINQDGDSRTFTITPEANYSVNVIC